MLWSCVAGLGSLSRFTRRGGQRVHTTHNSIRIVKDSPNRMEAARNRVRQAGRNIR